MILKGTIQIVTTSKDDKLATDKRKLKEKSKLFVLR